MERPTALDIVTLVVAILAFGVAVASLMWQVASWRLSGPRVRVETGVSLSVATGEPLISVAARNTGRADAQITSWAIQLPDERTYVPALSPGDFMGPSVPLRLAGGHSETWYVRLSAIGESILRSGYAPDTELRGVVVLGSGRYVVSRRAIRPARPATSR